MHHLDRSLMECWRCENCGNFPRMPNAPPIEEYSDDDSFGDDEMNADFGDVLAYFKAAGFRMPW